MRYFALPILFVAFASALTFSSADAEAKKNKNIYEMKLKFCGFVGPDSNFATLGILPGSPNIRDHFKEKEMTLRASSFNGKDKLRTTARRFRNTDFTPGEQKTYKCNKKKGGCKFKISWTAGRGYTGWKESSYRVKVPGFKAPRQKTLVFKMKDDPIWTKQSDSTTEASFKITRMLIGDGYAAEKYCDGTDSGGDCTYRFNDTVIEYSLGNLSCN